MITPLSPDGELMRYATDTKTVEVKPGQTSSVVMSMTAIFCRGCDYHDLTEATCTEPGIAKITCEINDEHNKETEIHEALGHEWPEEWEIITPAECEIPGEKIKRCLRGPESCSDFEETGTEIETIEALEHEWEYDESANPPTCLLPGNGKRVCEACGEEEETGDYPALGHKWSDTIAASYCKVVDDVFVHGTGTNYQTCYNDGCFETLGEPGNIPCLGTEGLVISTNNQLTSGTVANGVSGIICIPARVTRINSGAFRNNTGITKVVFAEDSEPDMIVELAFQNCTNLTSIEIPASVTTIGNLTFDGCSKLESVIFAENSWLTTFAVGVFQNCTSLTSIEIPASVTNLGTGTFRSTGITNIQIPSGITKIDENTFHSSKLESIEIPASVTSIENYAFNNCTNLNTVLFAIDSQLNKIGMSAFTNCTIESIEIPAGVTSIGSSAFFGCGLTSIEIPAGVISIGSSAFSGCSQLTEVTLNRWENGDGDPITALGGINVFSLTHTNLQIYVPTGSAASYRAATNWNISGVVNRIHETGCTVSNPTGTNTCLCGTSNGLEFTDIGNAYSVAWDGTTTITNVVIPAIYEGLPVTKIADEAFYDCDKLQSIEIPASVTSIGDNAFYNCGSLTSVTFVGDSQLETIGAVAFGGCTILESIEIPASVTYIGNTAFYLCSNLATVTINREALTVNDVTKLEGIDVFLEADKLDSIFVPVGSAGIYRVAENWNDAGNVRHFIHAKECEKSTPIGGVCDCE